MEEERLNVYQHVARFKNKYPLTIGWRYRKNASIVEKHLNPGEYVVYAFIAQKNNNPFNIFGSAVVALTNERILIGRKRVVFGYFLDSITPDLFNDLKMVCPIYCKSININAAKYNFNASTASTSNSLSELKIPIKNSGAKIITLHMIAV